MYMYVYVLRLVCVSFFVFDLFVSRCLFQFVFIICMYMYIVFIYLFDDVFYLGFIFKISNLLKINF